MTDTAFYDDQYDRPAQPGGWRRTASAAFASLLSLAVLGGVIAWAYQISVREPYAVPVVVAVDGPMKMRPEESGGLILDSTEKRVTEILKSGDSSGEATLAPPSQQPAPEDKPVVQLREETAQPAAAEPSATQATQEVAAIAPTPQASDPAAAPAAEPPRVQAVSPGLTAADPDDEVGVAVAPAPAPAPRSDPTPRVEPTAVAPDTTTGTPVQPVDDIARILAPAPEARPTPPEEIRTARTVTAAPAPVAPAQPGRQIEPMIQLGAFSSQRLAERVWQDHQIVNGRLFTGLKASITTVQSGGQELYRLRVGPFQSEADARKICVVLKARSGDCIVVTTE